MDRFNVKVLIEYLFLKEDEKIVISNTAHNDFNLNQIISKEELLDYQKLVKNVPVSDNLIEYAVKFVHNTRPGDHSLELTNKYIAWGAGPRASSFLILAAKAKAVLNGKATPDIGDLQSVVKSVLRHRIIINFNAEAEGIRTDKILDMLMEQ